MLDFLYKDVADTYSNNTVHLLHKLLHRQSELMLIVYIFQRVAMDPISVKALEALPLRPLFSSATPSFPRLRNSAAIIQNK